MTARHDRTGEQEQPATPIISEEHRKFATEADFYGYRGEHAHFWRQYLRDSVIAAIVILIVAVVVLVIAR